MKIPLFDIDFTLASRIGNVHEKAYDFALKKVYNIKASANETSRLGKTDNQILVEILMLHGITEEAAKKKIKLADKAMAEYFLKHESEAGLFLLAGVIELLTALKKKKNPMGILSGNVEEIGWRKMELLGIKHFFDFGSFGSLSFKRAELIPIAQKRAQKVLNKKIEIKDFVIFDDAELAIQMAKKAGVKSIGVATGKHSTKELLEAGADLVVESLNEKEKVLNFLSL